MILKINIDDIKMMISINSKLITNTNNDNNKNNNDSDKKSIIILDEYNIDILKKFQNIEKSIQDISNDNLIYFNAYDNTLMNLKNDNNLFIFENIIDY